MVNILSNGVDFAAIARSTYADNGIGLSSRARAMNAEFFNGATDLFNGLIIAAEDQEANLALQIRALQSKLGVDTDEVARRQQNIIDRENGVPVSQTLGTEVDTDA